MPAIIVEDSGTATSGTQSPKSGSEDKLTSFSSEPEIALGVQVGLVRNDGIAI